MRFGSMNAALSTEEEKRVEMTYTRHGNSTIMQKAYMHTARLRTGNPDVCHTSLVLIYIYVMIDTVSYIRCNFTIL